MSPLETMIKHTGGAQGVTTGRSKTPETGPRTRRSPARCFAACRLNTSPGYVPAWSRPKPHTRPERASRGDLEHAESAIQHKIAHEGEEPKGPQTSPVEWVTGSPQGAKRKKRGKNCG